MQSYDLSGAANTWWDVREPLPAMPKSPPKLRRTDTSRDVCGGPSGGPMTESELDAKIMALKRRNQRLYESVERLRAEMRAELKLD